MAALDSVDLRLLGLIGLAVLVPLAAAFGLRLGPLVAAALSATSTLLIVGMLWVLWGPAEAADPHDHGDGGETATESETDPATGGA